MVRMPQSRVGKERVDGGQPGHAAEGAPEWSPTAFPTTSLPIGGTQMSNHVASIIHDPL